jgi:hypothetical protein
MYPLYLPAPSLFTLFDQDLRGKPVPTFPDHATASPD